MSYTLQSASKQLQGSIQLPASKSISNRLLVMSALVGGRLSIENLSESKDTQVILSILNEKPTVIDVGQAGAAMRFLTAYFAQEPGEWIITGSERMKKRPIGELVKALRQLGANIKYTENEGYPPLQVKGKKLSGKKVKIDGSVSSQYITALLLIAPALPGGLELQVTNRVSSQPYIMLSLRLMEKFGIIWEWKNNTITVYPGEYLPGGILVEADWSGASYLYELMAFAEEESALTVKGLGRKSLQGDAVITNLFEPFGVKTSFLPDGVSLYKEARVIDWFEFNFSNYPDLVQTFVVTCAMLKVPFRVSGAESLRIKETDRIKALQTELQKFGVHVKEECPGTLVWDGTTKNNPSRVPVIDTYDDHRMALAFAPAVLSKQEITIHEPEVVVKSYPGYWDDLRKLGINIKEE